MERLCTNFLTIGSPDSELLDSVLQKIQEVFECYYVIKCIGNNYEVEFGTSSTFPKEELESLTKDLKSNDIYIWVFSYDFSNKYFEFHTYDDGKWKDMLSSYRKEKDQ